MENNPGKHPKSTLGFYIHEHIYTCKIITAVKHYPFFRVHVKTKSSSSKKKSKLQTNKNVDTRR